MGRAVGQLIPLAVGVALSPLPIIAVILMLSNPGGRVTGPSFLAGWALSLTALCGVVLIAADEAHASQGGGSAAWVGVVQLVLGGLLLLVAAQQWRGRPRGDAEPELPGWMQRVQTLTAPRAAAVAVGLAAVKPKNLLLTVGAATAIAQAGAPTAQQAAAVIVFVLVASLGLGIYFLTGDRAAGILAGMRDWMVRENSTIVALVCLLIAAKLIGDGITVLTV